MDQNILIVALKHIIAEYNLGSIKGPKWVTPTKKEIYEELKEEKKDLVNDVPKDQILASLEGNTVETLKGGQIRKIGDIFGPLADYNFKVPEDWLDPTKNVGMEFSTKYRYSHRHHKNLIPDMINGGQVTMPIVLKQADKHYAISGRHRINYAYQLDIPLKITVLSEGFNKLFREWVES